MRWKIVALLVFVILSNAIGNFFLSLGLRKAPAGASALAAYFQPAVLFGVGLLIAWTVTRIFLLEIADLSFVLPVTSIGFVLNTLLGAMLLGEHVSIARWTGTLLIVAGAALAGWTRPDTVEHSS
jgi:uncharacterized membrane protein